MLDMGSVVNQGLIGMQKSQVSMAQSAQQIARSGTAQPIETSQSGLKSPDLAESLVNIKIQSQIFDSSARVIKSANESIGTLLDTKA